MPPTATNPARQPAASMATPASGDPSATPVVMAAPCQPSASPRTDSGTTRDSRSTAAVSDGAQKTPATSNSAAKPTGPGAAATGRVAAASRPTGTSRGSGRCRAPYDDPAQRRAEAPDREHPADPRLVVHVPQRGHDAHVGAAEHQGRGAAGEQHGGDVPGEPARRGAVRDARSAPSRRIGGSAAQMSTPPSTDASSHPSSAQGVGTAVARTTPSTGPIMNEISTATASTDSAVVRRSSGTRAISACRTMENDGISNSPAPTENTSSGTYPTKGATDQHAASTTSEGTRALRSPTRSIRRPRHGPLMPMATVAAAASAPAAA